MKLLAAIAFALALVGCGGGDATPEEVAELTVTPAPPSACNADPRPVQCL